MKTSVVCKFTENDLLGQMMVECIQAKATGHLPGDQLLIRVTCGFSFGYTESETLGIAPRNVCLFFNLLSQINQQQTVWISIWKPIVKKVLPESLLCSGL
jgi:hypothetical protein